MDPIQEHYKKLAGVFGDSKEMSMEDTFTKESEITEIIKNITYFSRKKRSRKVLEIGCGNGYTARIMSDSLDIDYTGIDFCDDLVKIASERKIEKYRFNSGNVLDLEFRDNTFDIIFSERCLINLDSWEKQKKSISEIFRVLKKGGIFIMVECFTDGLDNLNEARRVLGLPPVVQKFHNLYFDKSAFMDFIEGKFSLYGKTHPDFASLQKSNFLSTYYYGRSVLYPAINQNKELEYNNKFVEFFSYLEPHGEYSYIQSIVLEKV